MSNVKIGNFVTVGTGALVLDSAVVSGRSKVLDLAKVRGQAHVYEDAEIRDRAIVKDNAVIRDYAQVYGNAIVSGNAIVTGRAKVFGCAVVSHNAAVQDNAQVRGNAYLNGYARVGQDADVFRQEHTVTITGMFPDAVTIYRTVNGGHRVQAGCQNFTLDEDESFYTDLAYREEWGLPPTWVAFMKMMRVHVQSWRDDMLSF